MLQRIRALTLADRLMQRSSSYSDGTQTPYIQECAREYLEHLAVRAMRYAYGRSMGEFSIMGRGRLNGPVGKLP